MGREFGASAKRARGKAPDLTVETRRGLLKDVDGLPKSREIRGQAYRLVWRPDREVRIEAEGAAGAFYGAVTLRQILATQAEGVEVPAGVVEDWPALRWRGLQDDLARGRVYNMAHAKRQIRHWAELKGNLYQLYLETRFAFPRRPDASLPGSMTPEDARELEAYAARFGVTLLPQVNTLSHLELLLSKDAYAHLREKPDDPHVICPLHPQTRPLLKDLLDDVMDAFETSLVPVGLDEVWHFSQCERCRGKDPGDLFLDHIRFLHGVVTARGRRMLVWHDMLLDRMEFAGSVANGPAEWAERVLEALPRDIVICDWQYTSTNDTTLHFTKKGFDALACDSIWGPVRGGVFPFDFAAAWHTSRFYAQARRSGAAGALQTTWGDAGRSAFENRWVFYAHAASTGWQPAQRVRLRRMAEAWARVEMGADGLAYEDLVARLSVGLFGGTGKRSITVEETGPKFPSLRHARSWWRAVGPRLLTHERAYTDDLARRLEALRGEAKRGREFLALMDYPILLRRLALDEVARVGRAARLYARALALPEGDARRGDLARRAARLLREHADALEELEPCMRRLADAQGVAEEQFEKARAEREDLRARAARLEAGEFPSFEEVFWSEGETPYGR